MTMMAGDYILHKSFRWILFLPIFYLLATVFWGDLGADPSKKLTHLTGKYAFYYLLSNILLGAIFALWPKRLRPLVGLLQWRRWMGVLGYLILFGHVLFYFFLESFEVQALQQIFSKNYLLFGFSASLLMSLLALTSNDFSIRILGAKRWKMIHRSVYLVTVLLAGHLLLIEKADVPYYGSLFTILLSIGIIRFLKRNFYEKKYSPN